MDDCGQRLRAGLDQLNLPLEPYAVASLLAFITLIEKWNQAYNLTAIRKKEDMVSLHLLDSLAVWPHLHGERILDVGTGAGLPGIPLAVACPDLAFTLLDSNAKKTRFVQQAVLELKLKNVTVCHQRIEAFRPAQGFTCVLTRAFAGLADTLALARPLLADGGVVLALKSQQAAAEMAQLAAPSTLIPVNVPGIAAERYVVRIAQPEQPR